MEPCSNELFHMTRIYNEHLTEEKQGRLRGEYHVVNHLLLSMLTMWGGEDSIKLQKKTNQKNKETH